MDKTFQFVASLLLIGFAWTESNPDEVTSLPGMNFEPPFKHYAGYLEASEGHFHFYWFFESQRDPAKDPVLLWLNGGPGCSSVVGSLTENGPLQLLQNLSLQLNPFAWNTRANVLYIESPTEVGFSYNSKHDSIHDDNEVAEGNFAALKSFFEKYPHLKENDFYISGESYGGIYIPTLSVVVSKNQFPPNFRGLAIGNGMLSYDLDRNSRTYFFARHGFLSDVQWNAVATSCCANVPIEDCDFNTELSPECQKAFFHAEMLIEKSDAYFYNIYLTNPEQQVASYPVELMKNLSLSSSRKNLKGRSLNKDNESDLIAQYLNQAEIKKALHVRPESLSKWTMCSDPVFDNYNRIYDNMTEQVKHLLEKGLKVLIYNGNFDSACNFISDMWFSEKLGYPVAQEYQRWNTQNSNELGGFFKEFKVKQRFHFVTVTGAGHMVPSDRPEAAQDMIYRFLIDA